MGRVIPLPMSSVLFAYGRAENSGGTAENVFRPEGWKAFFYCLQTSLQCGALMSLTIVCKSMRRY